MVRSHHKARGHNPRRGASRRPVQKRPARPRRPAQSPAQQKVLRIGIIHGGKILEERIIRRRESVTVGHSEKAHFVLATRKLPGRFEMFELKGDEYQLNFTKSMSGRISLKGEVIELAALREDRLAAHKGRFYQIPLDDQARGKVVIDEITVLFQFVAPPPIQPRPQLPAAVRGGVFKNLEWFITLLWVISFMLHTAAIAYFELNDWPEPDRWEQFLKLQELISADMATFELEKPKEEQVESDEKKEEKKEKKKEPKPEPEKQQAESSDEPVRSAEEIARERAERRAELAELATQRGINKILGSLGAHGEGAIADVLRGGDVGADQDELLSQVQGVNVATGDGGNLSGMALGKDGAEAADVSQIQMKGGDATVKTKGPGERTVKAKIKRRNPSAVAGSGVLSAVDVAKVVSRRLGALKGCYERASKRNPNLRGKITVRFTIAASGKVTSVDIVLNELNQEVSACIQKTFKLFRFPPPQGGAATFEYPFMFIPAG